MSLFPIEEGSLTPHIRLRTRKPKLRSGTELVIAGYPIVSRRGPSSFSRAQPCDNEGFFCKEILLGSYTYVMFFLGGVSGGERERGKELKGMAESESVIESVSD